MASPPHPPPTTTDRSHLHVEFSPPLGHSPSLRGMGKIFGEGRNVMWETACFLSYFLSSWQLRTSHKPWESSVRQSLGKYCPDRDICQGIQ